MMLCYIIVMILFSTAALLLQQDVTPALAYFYGVLMPTAQLSYFLTLSNQLRLNDSEVKEINFSNLYLSS
jgi:hypothetical protein